MSGFVIDLNNFNVRTPEQSVRIFFSKYSPEEVEIALWKAMAVMSRSPNFETQETFLPKEAANLFDQLIALVKAVNDLMEEPAPRCPVCKREASEQDESIS